jgi:hypothetical protein
MIRNARASGSVTSDESAVGGLVGFNRRGGTIQNTFAVGAVTSNESTFAASGLIGQNGGRFNNGTVDRSYFDKQATDQTTSAGDVIGLTTAEMQGQAARTSMSGLNFQTTWTTTDGYPALRVLSDVNGGSEGGSDGPVPADVDPGDLPGSGSESDPYEIANASELQAMEDDLNANYELVSDIDASQTAQFDGANGFDPVGPSFDTQFTGSFDGNNYTITGLTINRPTENRVGLIGVLDDEGTIRDVSVIDASITGDRYAGIIAGTTDGEVVSSSVTGAVTGSDNVGGLAGSTDGLLRESSARVTVKSEAQAGGLVGANSDTIRESYATGSVNVSGNRVGGLVGINTNNAI